MLMFAARYLNSAPRRYLVPADLTVGQFVYVIRKRIKVGPEKAIFMFVKNTLPPTGGFTQFRYQGMHLCNWPYTLETT